MFAWGQKDETSSVFTSNLHETTLYCFDKIMYVYVKKQLNYMQFPIK